MKIERTVTTKTETTISLTGSDIIDLLNASRPPDDQIPTTADVDHKCYDVDDDWPVMVIYTTIVNADE